MSNAIQINKQSIIEDILGTYYYYNLQIKNKKVEVTKAPTRIYVTYHNASHKLLGFGFGGRVFNSFAEAIKQYKDKDILSMLSYVLENYQAITTKMEA